jgi:hypothetical protein
MRGSVTTSIKVDHLDIHQKGEMRKATDPENPRSDVDFNGTITINGRKLPFELHLFRVDKQGWQIGKWYASMKINEKPRSEWKNREEVEEKGMLKSIPFPDLPENCCYCHKESDVSFAVAAVVHKYLNDRGFEIAAGIGNQRIRVGRGKYKMSEAPWWLFDLYVDSQGPVKYGKSRRTFYHKETRDVVCPVHGAYRLEKEESSL